VVFSVGKFLFFERWESAGFFFACFMCDGVGKIKQAKNALHSLGKNKCLLRWEKTTRALAERWAGWVKIRQR